MTRFTEAGLRMLSTIVLDEGNQIRSEPPDNFLTEFYLTEMQVTNVEQVGLLFPHFTLTNILLKTHHSL
jgi:hypothetical protein